MAVGDFIQGRRRPDLAFDEVHPEIQPGDYWKILDASSGEPRAPDPPQPTNLTGTCWYVVVPLGLPGGFGLGRLEAHTVREHEDGTISVRRGDGSSNSILISRSTGSRWHGFIEHGVFEEVA